MKLIFLSLIGLALQVFYSNAFAEGPQCPILVGTYKCETDSQGMCGAITYASTMGIAEIDNVVHYYFFVKGRPTEDLEVAVDGIERPSKSIYAGTQFYAATCNKNVLTLNSRDSARTFKSVLTYTPTDDQHFTLLQTIMPLGGFITHTLTKCELVRHDYVPPKPICNYNVSW